MSWIWRRKIRVVSHNNLMYGYNVMDMKTKDKGCIRVVSHNNLMYGYNVMDMKTKDKGCIT